MPDLDLEVHLVDFDFVKELMQVLQQMLMDPELPEHVRLHYSEKVVRILPENLPGELH